MGIVDENSWYPKMGNIRANRNKKSSLVQAAHQLMCILRCASVISMAGEWQICLITQCCFDSTKSANDFGMLSKRESHFFSLSLGV